MTTGAWRPRSPLQSKAMSTSPIPPEIKALVDDHQRLTTALDEARRRAIQTESDRLAAEETFAQAVANSLVSGKALPAKPAALSAAQAADDSTDAAVQIIEDRLRKLTANLHTVMHQRGLNLLHDEYAAAAKTARQALHQIAAGIAALYTAVGPNLAHIHVSNLAAQVPHTLKLRRQQRLIDISESTTVEGRRAVAADQDEGQLMAENKWPTGDDVRAIAISMDGLATQQTTENEE